MVNKELRNEISERYGDNLLLFDNPSFDNSIIGVDENYEHVIYDYDKMVEEYAKDNSCEYEEAEEFIDYNTIRAMPYYKSQNGPIVMHKLEN